MSDTTFRFPHCRKRILCPLSLGEIPCSSALAQQLPPPEALSLPCPRTPLSAPLEPWQPAQPPGLSPCTVTRLRPSRAGRQGAGTVGELSKHLLTCKHGDSKVSKLGNILCRKENDWKFLMVLSDISWIFNVCRIILTRERVVFRVNTLLPGACLVPGGTSQRHCRFWVEKLMAMKKMCVISVFLPQIF